ncbi:response regulator [Sphingomonas sp. CFBP 8764]|uniref:response regulator n=1 Tax=Sphingomonas sp. CFBP 8764 TaxID=2775275 RepID=UPI001786AA28|nr:response regulator [Sphingomonas sp. CFBP 8764]MBD8552077.1 response regulator [Sphingomonas sp. CFBP 8764]
MSVPVPKGEATPSILIVDGDIISRHAIADYLRHCGYAVVEAATTDEAMKALGEPSLGVDVILCDASATGSQSAFGLSTWVRNNRPELEVRLAGSLEGILNTAADLCEHGPHLLRPYEPQAIVDYIKQLRASRDRASR